MNKLPEVWHLLLSLWVDDPLAASGAHPTAMGRLKEAVMSKRVDSRSWRLYLDYGDALFEQLGPPWIRLGKDNTVNEANALVFLRLLQACEMDVLPPPVLLRSMARWEIPDQRLDLIPPSFFRAAWKMCILGEYTAQAQIEAFVKTRIVPVCQWFFATHQHVDANHNQLKAGWVLLERRYQEFFATRQRCELQSQQSETSPTDWLTPVLQAECDGLLFTALTHEAALQAEGERMAHCIGGYASRCRSSTLRAYSVTDSKTRQRVATLTVVYSSASQNWQIDDMKGPKNAAISSEVVMAAFGLLRCLDNATNTNPQVRQELNRLSKRPGSVLVNGPNLDMDDCPHF
ncbi:MAG: PcfJ domain-containing protein [Comamonadaceae bacterium]|nr:PcfJ domain-containing protein [Comamonadaceae bacterium]